MYASRLFSEFRIFQPWRMSTPAESNDKYLSYHIRNNKQSELANYSFHWRIVYTSIFSLIKAAF